MILSFEYSKRVFLFYNGYTESPFSHVPKSNVDQSMSPNELRDHYSKKKGHNRWPHAGDFPGINERLWECWRLRILWYKRSTNHDFTEVFNNSVLFICHLFVWHRSQVPKNKCAVMPEKNVSLNSQWCLYKNYLYIVISPFSKASFLVHKFNTTKWK